jgi:hypothetical protein
VVRFTGLVFGVPTSLPHKLNVDGYSVAPRTVEANRPGFFISVDDTNVTVTRNGSADDAVDVYVHHWHSYGSENPGDLEVTGKVPFNPEDGTIPIYTIWARSAKGFPVTPDNVPKTAFDMPTSVVGADPTTANGAGMLIMSAAAALADGSEAATWIETIPIRIQNGVITAIGGPPLPATIPPSANTAGAAGWALVLANPAPSIVRIDVVGDPLLSVGWTVRMGGTFTPHVAD